MHLKIILDKISARINLLKGFQTGLLLITGVTGYISAQNHDQEFNTLLWLFGSLFLVIGGSTVLNMVYDRDIDAVMRRTILRPLPTGKINLYEALISGVLMCLTGLFWSFTLSVPYGMVVTAGLVLDLLVYTVWLKRKTHWSILWGGLSGGMPILAGRVLGLGYVDAIGILLALAILLWIPTHILTFNMRYFEDYKRAQIPTFVSRFGSRPTRFMVIISSLGASIAMGTGLYALGLAVSYLHVLFILTTGILILGVLCFLRPSNKTHFTLFRYASFYMLGAMLIAIAGLS